MKVNDIIKVPALKPRDPNQRVMAAKKNAGGPMRDKAKEMERGKFKHKARMYEAEGAEFGKVAGMTIKDPYGDQDEDHDDTWYIGAYGPTADFLEHYDNLSAAFRKLQKSHSPKEIKSVHSLARYVEFSVKADTLAKAASIVKAYITKVLADGAKSEKVKTAAKKPREAPKMPAMKHPGIRVSMPEAWRDRLNKAVKKLGHSIEGSGYGDGSTTWEVAFAIDKKFNKAEFEDKLRDELGYSGWMSVRFFDLTEEE